MSIFDQPNISCRACGHRHPQTVTCERAKQAAAQNRPLLLVQHLIQAREAERAIKERHTQVVMDALYRGCRVSMCMDETLIEEPGTW
jgi:hypothetical protein